MLTIIIGCCYIVKKSVSAICNTVGKRRIRIFNVIVISVIARFGCSFPK